MDTQHWELEFRRQGLHLESHALLIFVVRMCVESLWWCHAKPARVSYVCVGRCGDNLEVGQLGCVTCMFEVLFECAAAVTKVHTRILSSRLVEVKR